MERILLWKTQWKKLLSIVTKRRKERANLMFRPKIHSYRESQKDCRGRLKSDSENEEIKLWKKKRWKLFAAVIKERILYFVRELMDVAYPSGRKYRRTVSIHSLNVSFGELLQKMVYDTV